MLLPTRCRAPAGRFWHSLTFLAQPLLGGLHPNMPVLPCTATAAVTMTELYSFELCSAPPQKLRSEPPQNKMLCTTQHNCNSTTQAIGIHVLVKHVSNRSSRALLGGLHLNMPVLPCTATVWSQQTWFGQAWF